VTEAEEYDGEDNDEARNKLRKLWVGEKENKNENEGRMENTDSKQARGVGSEGGIGILAGESGVQRDLPIGAGTNGPLTLHCSSPSSPLAKHDEF
jgi:hypothetical protein